jgi:hypothetical protein
MESLLIAAGILLVKQYREIQKQKLEDELGAYVTPTKVIFGKDGKPTLGPKISDGGADIYKLPPRNDADLKRYEYNFKSKKDFDESQPSFEPNKKGAPSLPFGGNLQRDLFNSTFNEGFARGSGTYIPGWARSSQQGSMIRRQEEMNDFDDGNYNLDPMPEVSDEIRQRGRRALDPKTEFQYPPIEAERVRPPRMGGDEGYDAVRGRAPIPRFNQYYLGDDRTTGLSDQGRSRGFAVGQAARSEPFNKEAWEIMPDRSIQAPARNQHLPFRPASVARNAHLGSALTPEPSSREAIEWDNGATGRRAEISRGIVAPERDPSDRRYLEGSVDAYTSGVGSRGQSDIPRRELPKDTKDIMLQMHRKGLPTYKAGSGSNQKNEVNRANMAPTVILPQIQAPAVPMFNASQGSNVRAEVARRDLPRDAPDVLTHVRPPRLPSNPAVARRSQDTRKSVSQAAGKTGWKFSFHLKDIINADTPISAPPRATREEVIQPIDPQPKSITLVERRAGLDLPSVAPERTRAPQNMVLFSDEERNSYKEDSKKLVDLDLSGKTRKATQGAGQRQNATGFKSMNEVNSIVPVTAAGIVNTGLRAKADAPAKEGIGDAKHAVLEFPSTSIFAGKQVRISPRVVEIDVDTAHATNNIVRRPTSVFKTDAGFAKQQSRVSRPLVDYTTDVPGRTQGLGKDQTDVFPSTALVQKGTTTFRSDRKEDTAVRGGRKTSSAGKFAGASKPLATISGTSFRKESNTSIDLETDKVMERGGELRLPITTNPHIQDGTQPRIEIIDAGRVDGEFRRR